MVWPNMMTSNSKPLTFQGRRFRMGNQRFCLPGNTVEISPIVGSCTSGGRGERGGGVEDGVVRAVLGEMISCSLSLAVGYFLPLILIPSLPHLYEVNLVIFLPFPLVFPLLFFRCCSSRCCPPRCCLPLLPFRCCPSPSFPFRCCPAFPPA